MTAYSGDSYLSFIGLDAEAWGPLAQEIDEAIAEAAMDAAEAVVAQHAAEDPLLRALSSPYCPPLWIWADVDETNPVKPGDLLWAPDGFYVVNKVSDCWYECTGRQRDLLSDRRTGYSVARSRGPFRVRRPVPADLSADTTTRQ